MIFPFLPKPAFFCRTRSLGLAAVFLLALCPGWTTAQTAMAARAWEEPLVIPTYLVEAPDLYPIFYAGRAYQGAKGPVYPYPFLDRLTDVRQDKTYKAVYLENRYLKLCILPELGGRLFSAQDKTNGYDFIYRQHVIKPALIGMLGAWISGGVEWNIPHHHRATTFMPVDHILVNTADGSATVWVGETELRGRTRWLVAMTLRPDSSALEVTVRTFNRTPLAQSMLCFANAAIAANLDYQVLFPPDTTVATFHGKNQFARWPVSAEVFNGQDYRAGVDVSWWKSHSRPTSFFAFDGEGDFLAGYDHGKQAGVCFVGDHHVVPGKKLWTWGTGSEGALWEKILTDADGPYAELMFGAWSDNQPDYSWTKSLETRSVKQWWYPLRGIGGVKEATKDAACDLDIRNGRAHLAVYATRSHTEARVVLSVGIRTIHERKIDIAPDRPFAADVSLPDGIPQDELALSLWTSEGRELVRTKPISRVQAPLPPAVTPPLPPLDITTAEELTLTGQRLEQFHNPALEPYPYYEEALRRDPGDSRANTALGLLYLRRGLYREAENCLARAVERQTKNYTRPKEGEALYALGLARRALGKTKEAEDAFQRAAWDEDWQAASFFQLAEMSSAAGDFGRAVDFLERARARNAQSPKIAAFLAAMYRLLGQPDKAKASAAEALGLDALDFWAWNETVLDRAARDKNDGDAVLRRMSGLMRDAPANYLELAADYLRCGLYDEVVNVLARQTESGKKGSGDFPLLHYMMAYVLAKKGDEDGALRRLRLAAACPTDYGFPFQFEFVDILRWAHSALPEDGRAPYYLGNLLFDSQPEAAIAAWEEAAALEPGLALVHRNLGQGYARIKNDLPKAMRQYELALAAAPSDARLYEEYDRVAEAAGVPATRRLALLERRHAVVAKRDDALSREIGLLVQTGKYDRALDLLENHHFHVWEGGGEIHGVFVEAHLRRGEDALDRKRAKEALADFEAAMSYPRNLEVSGPSVGGGSARVFYLAGLAREALGDSARARADFEKAASFGHAPSEAAYFEALALHKMGRNAEADEKLSVLRKAGEERLRTAPAMDFFEKFGEKQSAAAKSADAHYLVGLALLGGGNEAGAAAEFKAALDSNPNHAAAGRALARLSVRS